MGEPGRPTDLTKELLGEIKQSILAGNDLRETAKVCGIVESTLYSWTRDNYLKLTDKIEDWHAERRLGKSVRKIEELVDSEEEKIALGASTFFAETLGKRLYSKRTEMTGADGKNLIPEPILSKANEIPDNNSNKEGDGSVQENTDSSRGNVSIEDGINTPILDSSSTVGQEQDVD